MEHLANDRRNWINWAVKAVSSESSTQISDSDSVVSLCGVAPGEGSSWTSRNSELKFNFSLDFEECTRAVEMRKSSEKCWSQVSKKMRTPIWTYAVPVTNTPQDIYPLPMNMTPISIARDHHAHRTKIMIDSIKRLDAMGDHQKKKYSCHLS